MDREQQNTPDTSIENTDTALTENTNPQTAEIPLQSEEPDVEQEPIFSEESSQSEELPEEEHASFTAVHFGKEVDVAETPVQITSPSMPQNHPSKKKRTGSLATKLLIAFVSLFLALVLLLIGLSTTLMAVIVVAGITKQTVAPPYSEETSISIDESPDENPSDKEPSFSAPIPNTETPPPSSYDSNAWYNPDDLTNDALSAYEKVCALCNPSIVAIETDVGSGSGIVWSSNGYIVTNNHVVEGATAISVMLSNGKKYPATLINTNVENDLALLRVNVSGLLPARLGNSDVLRMGQPVVAIGNPLGILSNTATEGILSAITREITVEGQTMNLMQISAPINPGNSGGGCFDINGNLIGVVNAKTSAAGIEGLGFAIPVNTAKTIIGQMIANDKTTLQKGIGVTGCYQITEDNYAEFNNENLIKQLEKLNGGPLYGIYIISDGLVDYVNPKETFMNGDVLQSVNGQDVKLLSDISAIVDKCAVGDELTITVTRLVQSGGFVRPSYSMEEHTFKIRVIEMYK